jgi:glutamate carboxypeptidase
MLPVNDFNDRTTGIVSLLTRLVKAESPTHDKAAIDQLGSLIASELRRLGGEVVYSHQEQAGDHIIARWNASNEQRSDGILVLCHMDTVHPLGSLAKNSCRVADGRLYGPGAQDMKAGIAIFLSTVKTLQEHNALPAGRPLTALITSDEETGSRTSRPLIEELAKDSGLVMCLESAMPNGALKTWRKGVGGYEIIAHGRAAHAGGEHAQGRNAIEELAHQVIAIQGLTDYERGTTLNVGVFQGGTVSNVVPSRARAAVDLRVLDQAEADRVEQALHALKPVLKGTSLEIHGGMNRPPMPRDARMAAAFEKAKAIAAGIGLELSEGGTGGGSDANFAAPLGVPVLDGLGAIGEGLHSDREYVLISSLAPRAALLAALICNW